MMEVYIFGATIFVGLIGAVYGNLRNGIKRNEELCKSRHDETEVWQEKDVVFKLDIIDRLARIETSINGGTK